MGFWESNMIQNGLAVAIIIYFLLFVYSAYRKRTVKQTLTEIKDWYQNLDGEENE